MVDSELFVHLAEIAGVFVGFGALIAVRNGEANDAHTVEYLRAIVAGGLLVVVAALTPLVVSRFGVDGGALWLPSSILFLALFLTFWFRDFRSSESLTDRTANKALTARYATIALPMTFLMLTADPHHHRRVAPARGGALLPGRHAVAGGDRLHPALARLASRGPHASCDVIPAARARPSADAGPQVACMHGGAARD